MTNRSTPRPSTLRAALALAAIIVGVIASGGCVVGQAGDEDIASAAAMIADEWGLDPCKVLAPTIQCHGHTCVGTPGPDIIFGTDGDDEIWGNGGDDIICAGDGDDVVHGGDGNDYIDGGYGNDVLYGDDGDDIIHGRAGSDEIHGGRGNDRLFGDLLDDKIWGDEGNDLLVGGHGADRLDGGEGDDYLRGDTNEDEFYGGPGFDTVSFETAMPPGQPQGTKNAPNPIDGVAIDFAAKTASGDGFEEPLDGIERVIGSPFNDSFVHASGRSIVCVYGDDTCDGAKCGKGRAPDDRVLVYLTPETRDLGLVVLGTKHDDHLEIAAVGKSIEVHETHGQTMRAGDGCAFIGGNQASIRCDIGSAALRFIVGWGDAGNDEMKTSGRFPRDITVHLDGGEGDDVLEGGDEEDVLFTGCTGHDVLRGGGGDDALISESYEWDKDLSGADYEAAGGGADDLDGGPGNDQLVVDYPCGGHFYRGGGGHDIAGFARSGSRPITAQLGGLIKEASTKQPFYGRAFNDLCADSWQKYATHIAGDLEILEGSDGDDILHGDDGDNTIWGRNGDDHIYGHGGDDVLRGLGGNDTIYGGRGHDFISGGDGFDWLYAGDGEADVVIACNGGGGVVVTKDAHDPQPTDCGGKPPAGGNGGNAGGGGQHCGGDDFSLPSGGDGHCYRKITARTWDQARTQCQAVGMHLATLSLTENQELAATNHIGSATWIGGHRQAATKQFYWVVQSETFPGDAPWYDPNEAHDPNGDRCVAVLQNGQWGLRSCDDIVQALCEDF